jgi:glycosyltransferase involved in cell wall biosynthesis
MQIHLLSSQFPEPRNARHPRHLPDDLSLALRKKGHRVTVDRLSDELIGHEPTTLSEGAEAGRRLAERLRRDDSGCVLHALDPVAWAAALTARSRADVVVVLRVARHVAPDPAGAAPLTPTERRAQRACLRAADAIAATAAGELEAAVSAGVAGERALLVPDLVGLPAARPVPARSPGRALVSLSGIGLDSGLDFALDTLRRLPGRILLIAGPGDQARSEALQARLRALDLVGRVHWLGWLKRAETVQLVDSAALLLCPSPTAGAMGAVEAMTRCRVVATVAGGRAADIVVDGVTGAVLPTDDPNQVGATLRTLLNNPFQLEAMGLAGRERALTLFAPDRAVDAAEQAYRIALGAP